MPAGWYPDPDAQEGGSAQRYWDGERWAAPGETPARPDDTSPGGSATDQESPQGFLESFGLGPRVMGYLILAVIAGAFIYFVLLGGESHQ